MGSVETVGWLVWFSVGLGPLEMLVGFGCGEGFLAAEVFAEFMWFGFFMFVVGLEYAGISTMWWFELMMFVRVIVWFVLSVCLGCLLELMLGVFGLCW